MRFSPIWTGDIMFSSVWVRQPRQRHLTQVGMALRAVPNFSWKRPSSDGSLQSTNGTARRAIPTWVGPAATLPVFLLLALAVFACPVRGQEARKIPISFLPPPLETATYSLGIYNVKSGQLVRRLQESATQDAFTVGLNGLITSWDGKDDAGKLVPPGKYAARGYAVGALKVNGVDIMGNDWAKDDETLRVKRVEAIALIPEDEGLAVAIQNWMEGPELLRFAASDGHLMWRAPLAEGPLGGVRLITFPTITLEAKDSNLLANYVGHLAKYRVSDGKSDLYEYKQAPFDKKFAEICAGKDGTVWRIEDGVLSQYSASGEKLRSLIAQPGDPVPVGVTASTKTDRLYLLERNENWQRVRGLSWVETKQENDKQVSTWQTFFERNIRAPDPALGLENPADPVEVDLVENPLISGKQPRIKLTATHDDKGSYLAGADGLRLRQISQRSLVIETRLKKGKATDGLTFFQNDAATWEEFSIEGAKNMMAFDAGEIDMTADGEKTHPEKAAEPPDL